MTQRVVIKKAKEQRPCRRQKTVLPRNRAPVQLPREFAEREAAGRDTVAASSLYGTRLEAPASALRAAF
jgi:hypothetical protein